MTTPSITINNLQELHIHLAPGDLKADLSTILQKLDIIMANQDEQTAQLQTISDGVDAVSISLTDVSAQLTKGFDEVVAEIAALKAAAGGDSTPAMDALFASIGSKMTALAATAAALKTAAQALDDLNPDPAP